jgi:hypothetical protein
VKNLGAAARAVTDKLDWSRIVGEFESALIELAEDGHEYEPAGLFA